jgi:intracellular multiplication protein IcmL
MAEKSLELVQLRNEFYRDNYKHLLIALLVMLIANVILAGMVFYQLAHQPLPQYFATSSDGKITKLYPLNEPVISPTALLQWATETSMMASSYNFVNYRDALQTLQNRFTADGWRNFEQALKDSRMLETVIAKKLVVSAVATGAPVILEQGVINGSYTWRVSLPILITYQSASETTQQSLIVNMWVSRVSIINNPDGIAVVSFVESERTLQ